MKKLTKSDFRRNDIMRFVQKPKTAEEIADHLELSLSYTKQYLRRLITDDMLFMFTTKHGERYQLQAWMRLKFKEMYA